MADASPAQELCACAFCACCMAARKPRMSLTEWDDGQLRMLAAVMADIDMEDMEDIWDMVDDMGVVLPAAPSDSDCWPPSGESWAAAAAAAWTGVEAAMWAVCIGAVGHV